MGLVLLVVIWLITFVSTYFFIAKTWWLPTGASAAAAGIDHHFATTYLVMGIVFVAAQLSLGYFAQVEVTGMQFQWYFRYPGRDGKFGATKPELIDASAGGESAIGLDTTDPASKDDVVTGTMVVPVNREVELILRAQDVIHSFFIPNMRFKQDAVPGLAIHMHFTPITIGDFEVTCAELCGLGHYKMHGMLRVVSQEEFDKWLAAREAEKQ